MAGAGAMVATALAFGEGPPPPFPRKEGQPYAAIARFARANWYAELRDRLEAMAGIARSALEEAGLVSGARRSWRRLVNSGLPERALALAAGLGSIGRSGLLLVPGAGPAVVLGLLMIPQEAWSDADDSPGLPSDSPERIPGAGCGDCRACVEACPTDAFSGDRFDRQRCIQHWTNSAGELPPAVEAAWGNRLYGCDACTEACPRYSGHSPVVPTKGILGPMLPAQELALATDGELRLKFKGTTIGQAWIETGALRRNARLALRASSFDAGAAIP
ncbi:MAG: 4Fe-4S double cluster binding domain-containing protein [Spirochaetota bacterium]